MGIQQTIPILILIPLVWIVVANGNRGFLHLEQFAEYIRQLAGRAAVNIAALPLAPAQALSDPSKSAGCWEYFPDLDVYDISLTWMFRIFP